MLFEDEANRLRVFELWSAGLRLEVPIAMWSHRIDLEKVRFLRLILSHVWSEFTLPVINHEDTMVKIKESLVGVSKLLKQFPNLKDLELVVVTDLVGDDLSRLSVLKNFLSTEFHNGLSGLKGCQQCTFTSLCYFTAEVNACGNLPAGRWSMGGSKM